MKIFNTLVAIATFFSSIAAANALDFASSAPGSLAKSIASPAEVTSLTISGPVDASDLFFIGREMTSLTSLDLKDATIVAYNRTPVNGTRSFRANTLPPGVFAGLPLGSVTLPSTPGLIIADCAFQGTAFKTVSLPANVDSVGMGVFSRCDNLTEVTFPGTTRLGTDIFADCEALTTVDLAGATVVPAATFRNCPALSQVKNSEQLTTIGDNAFKGDTSLKSFSFGKALVSIGDAAFAGSGIEDVDLSVATRLSELNDRAFAASAVTSVTLPDHTVTLGEGSFMNASNLTQIILPADIITISDNALKGTAITKLELPGNLETIGDDAFAGLDKVSSIVLPATLIRIGSYAMANMTGLAELDASKLDAVPETGQNVWYGVNQEAVTLRVSKTNRDNFSNADQWKEFSIETATDGVDISADHNWNPNNANVRGRFVGSILEIESAGAEMTQISIFDPSGRLLTSLNPASSSASIDTAPFGEAVIIITVILDNRSTAILKLARN